MHTVITESQGSSIRKTVAVPLALAYEVSYSPVELFERGAEHLRICYFGGVKLEVSEPGCRRVGFGSFGKIMPVCDELNSVLTSDG